MEVGIGREIIRFTGMYGAKVGFWGGLAGRPTTREWQTKGKEKHTRQTPVAGSGGLFVALYQTQDVLWALILWATHLCISFSVCFLKKKSLYVNACLGAQ